MAACLGCGEMAVNFWTVFAGVISANLLTVLFVWSCIRISRREQNKESLGGYLGGMLMPLLFCITALMISLDKVPVWLNAALR
jgi:hypothetical protein